MDYFSGKNSKQLLYLLLSFLTLLIGYFFLRYAYKVTDSTPFTQEIVLIILGTIATIFITALLLNQQTAVEIEKEQGIKFLELKTQAYENLLDLMEEMALANDFSSQELIKLQFITHRLAIVASPEVLDEYQNFLKVIAEISKDSSFLGDNDRLSQALGRLTVKIRQDLIGGSVPIHYSQSQVRTMIEKNSGKSSDIGKQS